MGEAVVKLSAIIFGISFLLFILGLIRPEVVIWGDTKKTRVKVFRYYGLALLLSYLLYSILSTILINVGSLGSTLMLVSFYIFIGLIIGLINPNLVICWGVEKTRDKVIRYYGLAFLLSLLVLYFLDLLS